MNKRKILSSFSYIDPLLIERSERKQLRAPFRIAAVCAALLLIIGTTLLISHAVNSKRLISAVPKEAVLPPSQTGSGNTADALYNKYYSLSSLYEESEAVCIVKIGNWLSEDEFNSFFEASVERVFKGEPPQKIVICQGGNSSFIFEGSPLFTYGDRILVGLTKLECTDYECAFSMVGADIAFMYAAELGNGELYLVDHKGDLSNAVDEELGMDRFSDYSGNRALINDLIVKIGENDAVLAAYLKELFATNLEIDKPRVFSLSEVENYFIEIG